MNLVLSAVDEDALLERLEGLLVGRAGWLAEDKLRLQAPVGGDVPGGGDLLVDQGIVVLEICTEAFLFESSPYYCDKLARLFCENSEVGWMVRRGIEKHEGYLQTIWCIALVCSLHWGNLSAYKGNVSCSLAISLGSS